MAKKTATKKKPAAARRKSKKSVRIALIGAGSRSVSTHYPALSDLPEADVVAACDLDEDRLQTACDRFGIQGRYGDYRQMIEREKPDAVYAIMPPHHLYDVSADIIERGCHLIVEKPPAVTTEQTRQLAALSPKAQRAHRRNLSTALLPLIRRGKERCEKRGDVHTAHASFYKNWVGADAYYKGGMDMLTADGIHAVDTLRYLCGGEVESVAADSRRLDAGHWNMHLALIKFSSGATGLLLNNFMAGRRIFSVEIHAPGISFFGDPEEGARCMPTTSSIP